jgi:pimeloyl-ACP methyl ester carboxylesterase
MNYTDTGHGEALVFIHGFCESLHIWTPYADELSKYKRVICVDLTGFGASAYLGEELSIEFFANEVIKLMNELKIAEFSVIGHSLGGYVCLALAEKYASRLRSMVLFHSTAFADSPLKKENRDKIASFIERNGINPFMESFVAPLFAEKNRENKKEEINFLIQEGKKANQEAVIKTIFAMKNRPDRSHILARFEKPILFIAGEDDVAVPINDSLQQIEQLKNGQSIVLKSCGHMGMFEKPITCLTKLKEFYLS